MRILVQALVAAEGGTGTVVRDLVAAWPNEDELLIATWRPSAVAMFKSTGHHIAEVSAQSTEEALFRLRLCPPAPVRQFQPDAVWSLGFYVGGHHVPQAVHYHDIGSFIPIHPATTRQRLKSLRERRDVMRADLHIFNSATMREAVHARYPAAAARRNVVIHNGLDLAPFQAAQTGSANLHRERTRRRILLPQSDAPHKRNWLAADVMQLLKNRSLDGTSIQLTVVGRGAYQDLRARLERYGLAGDAVFTGYVSRDKIAALYASHDVVLMTAQAESFGNPIIEAHAVGRPVVTPPFPVAIELGGPLAQTALADDAHSLVEAIERALILTIDKETLQDAGRFAQAFTADAAARSVSTALSEATRASIARRRDS
jgi:glycosyltransferase involved in cell wall biosynthesis